MAKKSSDPDIFCDGKLPCLAESHMIDEEHSNLHARLIHMHENELELFFVYRGQGQYMVQGNSYHVKEGDMVICNAGILHGEAPTQARRIHSYCIALTDVQLAGLPDNWLINSGTTPVISFGALSHQIGEMMRLIHSLFAVQKKQSHVCTFMGISILLLTFDLLQGRTTLKALRSDSNTGILAKQIQQYLDDHYREHLSLKLLGEIFHVSECHLAHVFKREIGMPPIQYAAQRRLGEAQSLLMDTLIPISEISERFGYNDPCHFDAMFKKHVGMSPSKYRDSFFAKESKTFTPEPVTSARR
jgi:AraC-like DNA-binding protein